MVSWSNHASLRGLCDLGGSFGSTSYENIRIDTTKSVVDNPAHEGAAPQTD